MINLPPKKESLEAQSVTFTVTHLAPAVIDLL
jgi:hypothetical protein